MKKKGKLQNSVAKKMSYLSARIARVERLFEEADNGDEEAQASRRFYETRWKLIDLERRILRLEARPPARSRKP